MLHVCGNVHNNSYTYFSAYTRTIVYLERFVWSNLEMFGGCVRVMKCPVLCATGESPVRGADFDCGAAAEKRF